jgi:hypothetical protein
MEKRMVQCEDGRERQARLYGVPREEDNFIVQQAGIRFKGKHVTGEAWQSLSTGICYFLSGPVGKNIHLLPRVRTAPEENPAPVHRSLTVRME